MTMTLRFDRRMKSELLKDVATPPPQRDAFRRFREWTAPAPVAGADGPDAGADGDDVLPLDLVQPDAPTLRTLQKLWRRRPEVYYFYLRRDIFPKATPTQVKKFSACAQELQSAFKQSTLKCTAIKNFDTLTNVT